MEFRTEYQFSTELPFTRGSFTASVRDHNMREASHLFYELLKVKNNYRVTDRKMVRQRLVTDTLTAWFDTRPALGAQVCSVEFYSETRQAA